MHSKERAPHDKETLLYDSPEAVDSFREQIDKRESEASRPDVRDRREAVSEAVVAELEQHGESAHSLQQPWEHTQEEHQEVQSLVDITFNKNLGAALAKARASGYYPRNIDLFHDVLTTEMYELLKKQNTNQQPIAGWVVIVAAILLIAFLSVVFVFTIG